MNKTLIAVALAAALILLAPGIASSSAADTHAPIGVMGDHMHKQGEWMLSYRFMTMPMSGNLVGDDTISPDSIVTSIPNRFFGNPGQPPTLRVVPTEMDMDMHMVGAMYAPSDRVTIMGMVNYVTKDMSHTTYQGGMGNNVLGTFTTKTSGLGDISLSALLRLRDTRAHKVHGIVGVSIPTGDVKETSEILTPMNMRPTVRLPYPMQLGSGSWDPIVGASYSGFGDALGWGAQWRSTFRLSDNDEDYRLGDEHRLTTWLSYAFGESVSTSIRLDYRNHGKIDGIDTMIVAPVQTADPNRQGGTRFDIGIGINLAGTGQLEGWRFAFEYLTPIEQDLNGPQLETDAQFIVGIQKAWH